MPLDCAKLWFTQNLSSATPSSSDIWGHAIIYRGLFSAKLHCPFVTRHISCKMAGWIQLGYTFILNLLTVIIIQLSWNSNQYRENRRTNLLRKCSNGADLTFCARFSMCAYEFKQSCLRFSFFGRPPGFNRSFLCSRNISRHCLLKLITNSNVGV